MNVDNGLEKLVPPRKLCEKIPPGAFADSALIWMFDGVDWWVNVREFDATYDEAYPAPTLAEIMADLARMELCPGVDMLVNIKGEICGRVEAGLRNVSFCGESTPDEAALKLWLELRSEQ